MQLGIMFLGASHLVGLLQRFLVAAVAEGVDLRLYTVEDVNPWHAVAVAGLAEVLHGPRFTDPILGDYLVEECQRRAVSIVIPNMDGATVGLAKAAARLRQASILPVVSSLEVCETFADKRRAEDYFRRHGFPTPSGVRYPLLAKPRFGASSRGQVLLQDSEDRRFWESRNRAEDYVIQPFVEGPEYSIDAYISGTGRCLGIIPRRRIVVSGGEVMVTQTERNPPIEELAGRLLSEPGWRGPVNLQMIRWSGWAYAA